MVYKKMRPLLRPAAVVSVILVTTVLFVRYITTHPEYITRLRQVDLSTLLWLLLTNSGLMVVAAVLNHISALICRIRLEKSESMLLTIYSSLANFFGPLQSGPGVRAAYLKTKYKVLLRDFTFVTFISYGIYAIISALFLVVGVLAWWQTLLVVSMAASFSVLALWVLRKRDKDSGLLKRLDLTPRLLAIVILATVVQVTLTAVRYGIELHAVGAAISVGQIISYAGAANFALFVSITPDGIGIREAFLLFSQQLHGVSTDHIVAASLIDRASYVVFLAILGIFALTLHARKRFIPPKQPRQLPRD